LERKLDVCVCGTHVLHHSTPCIFNERTVTDEAIPDGYLVHEKVNIVLLYIRKYSLFNIYYLVFVFVSAKIKIIKKLLLCFTLKLELYAVVVHVTSKTSRSIPYTTTSTHLPQNVPT
jgi:hypothetical protein